jgi:two-component system NtrC family sensor kinase
VKRKRKAIKDLGSPIPNPKSVRDFQDLTHRILRCATRGPIRFDFMREVTAMFIDFSGFDAVELRLCAHGKWYNFEATHDPGRNSNFQVMNCALNSEGESLPCVGNNAPSEFICRNFLQGSPDASVPFLDTSRSFYSPDLKKTIASLAKSSQSESINGLDWTIPYRSLILILLSGQNERIGGLLLFKSKKPNYAKKSEIEFYEHVGRTLEIALVHRSAQIGLRERIKELTCLYGISQVGEQHEKPLGEILQTIVQLLPPAWLYPEIACARITVDGDSYRTDGFKEGLQKQASDIIIGSIKRGMIEIIYTVEKPELDEGPFLKEERKLLKAIAKEVSLIIEKKEAEEEKQELQEQLRHADRLATIGQLSAGVAHELNEPLANILGFAQLAEKCPGLPTQAKEDINRIVRASLHAREVIKKLMIFARQMPPHKTLINLNEIIEESLYFLEARCTKQGIRVKRSLSHDLPGIIADPAQLTQVLVNLVVNAIQAMPEGGEVTIATREANGFVNLIVEDTGMGMSDEVLKKIFIPFYSTKEIDQGTGLGLPVVHGIVSSHGGKIEVESEPGRGSRFQIVLPAGGHEKADR